MAYLLREPMVSFLVSAFNEEARILEGVRSALSQEYKNYEVIVVNDGSTDGTLQRLREISDPRLVIVDKPNTGLVDSLNIGLSRCSGELIARQDADDVSDPWRLSVQVKAFLENRNLVLCGTWCYVVSSTNASVFRPPLSDVEIKKALQDDNQIVHSSAMFVKSKVLELGGYPRIRPCEDYALWLQLGRQGMIQNIPYPHVIRFETDHHITQRPFYTGLSRRSIYKSRLKCQLRAAGLFGVHRSTAKYLALTCLKWLLSK